MQFSFIYNAAFQSGVPLFQEKPFAVVMVLFHSIIWTSGHCDMLTTGQLHNASAWKEHWNLIVHCEP